MFYESLTRHLSAFVGLSSNLSRNLVDGSSLPSEFPEIQREPQTGSLRLGLSGSGQGRNLGWGAAAYLLAGTANSPASTRPRRLPLAA